MSFLLRFSPAHGLTAVATLLALALGLHGPIPQWADYHAFADARGWLGLPNAANVLSNLPFALIGLWGWWVHSRSAQAQGLVWRGFSLALIGTALGSALYHWAPSDGALVLDRLPIAWACALLTCALLAERIDPRWAGAPALAVAVLVGSAAVAWWWLADDLRPYLFVQFLPMLLVPVAIWSRLPARTPGALRHADWWIVLGLYAAAKVLELGDREVLDALGVTSGHTLKHLLAAAAALWLVRSAAQLR